MADFDTLISSIRQWGVDRNIIGEATSQAQFTKLLEEYGEAAEGVDETHIKDGIGDTMVVLTMIAGIEGFDLIRSEMRIDAIAPDLNKSLLIAFGKLGSGIARNDKGVIEQSVDSLVALLEEVAAQAKVDFIECLQEAYDEIKDRKGVLYNGCFIKEQDSRYQAAVEAIQARSQA